MPKFIFLYKGPVTAMSDMSPEEVKASGDQWGAWYGKLAARFRTAARRLRLVHPSLMMGRPEPLAICPATRSSKQRI